MARPVIRRRVFDGRLSSQMALQASYWFLVWCSCRIVFMASCEITEAIWHICRVLYETILAS